MKPIAFMRLRQLDRPEDILRHYKPKDLAVEQKYDGFKVMASRGPSGTKLYSRNGKDLTAKAPAIVKQLDRLLPNGTTVLGEMVYIANGQQELGLVQSVLHSAAALPRRIRSGASWSSSSTTASNTSCVRSKMSHGRSGGRIWSA